MRVDELAPSKGAKKKAKRNHFVHYSYVPGFGFYAFGLIHLVGAFAKSGTSLIRQLFELLQGGFDRKGDVAGKSLTKKFFGYANAQTID